MKFYAILCAVLAVCMLVMPALAFSSDAGSTNTEKKDAYSSALRKDPQSVTVLLTESGKAENVDLREYLIGAVAAEMPAVYDEQALMAQAVACHTYALYRRERESFSPDPSLQGADLSDDPALYQGYIDRNARKEKWGNDFDTYEEKIGSAVDAVQDLILTYDNEPIAAAFFALSAGRTESAANVFGIDLPYLQSVTSDADTLSPACSKTIVLSEKEFLEGMQKIELPEKITSIPEDCIGERIVRESGVVKSIELCRYTVSGQQVREAFALNSADFSIEQTESGYAIHTMGHGHFVGMSQYGAQQLALSGFDFRRILHHYYTDVKISDE